LIDRQVGRPITRTHSFEPRASTYAGRARTHTHRCCTWRRTSRGSPTSSPSAAAATSCPSSPSMGPCATTGRCTRPCSPGQVPVTTGPARVLALAGTLHRVAADRYTGQVLSLAGRRPGPASGCGSLSANSSAAAGRLSESPASVPVIRVTAGWTKPIRARQGRRISP
jgi:hypothetical protein